MGGKGVFEEVPSRFVEESEHNGIPQMLEFGANTQGRVLWSCQALLCLNNGSADFFGPRPFWPLFLLDKKFLPWMTYSNFANSHNFLKDPEREMPTLTY